MEWKDKKIRRDWNELEEINQKIRMKEERLKRNQDRTKPY